MGTIKRCLESARRRRLSRLRLKRCKRDLRLADGDVISLVGNALGEGVAHRNAIHLSSSAAARPPSIASPARPPPPCHVPAAPATTTAPPPSLSPALRKPDCSHPTDSPSASPLH